MTLRLTVVALLLVARDAAAHSAGAGGWGYLAPLADPALLIALAAGALWAGQQGHMRQASSAFATALALGLGANHLAGPARTQDTLLAATAAMGLLVVIGHRWPAWLIALLVAVLAVTLGRGVELGASTGLARLVTAGAAWALACVGVMAGAWMVARLRWRWTQVGVRIAASWISASALLVLALAFAP